MRNCRRVAIFPTLLIVCMLTVTSAGNDESLENSPATAAELRRTIAVLKLQIAELEVENQSLRQQIHRLNPPIPDLMPTFEPGPTETEGEVASPPSGAEGDQPAQNRKVFRSGAQILRELPGDLRPKPGVGWDKYTAPKRNPWLNENIVGHIYETRLAVRRVTVERDPFS